MNSTNQNPIISNNVQEDLKMEESTKKINIKTKDVVAAGFGIGAGVVVYEVGKEVFPIIVEKSVEIVTKFLSK